jgi:hypothetical protein
MDNRAYSGDVIYQSSQSLYADRACSSVVIHSLCSAEVVRTKKTLYPDYLGIAPFDMHRYVLLQICT